MNHAYFNGLVLFALDRIAEQLRNAREGPGRRARCRLLAAEIGPRPGAGQRASLRFLVECQGRRHRERGTSRARWRDARVAGRGCRGAVAA